MGHQRTTDTTIARLASHQLGLVSWPQLADAGVSEACLRRRLGSGSLVRIGDGVYRVAGAPQSWDQRALAACLESGAGAVLCGRSAATVWRLDLPAPHVVDVTTANRNGRIRSRAGFRIHQVRSLAPQDCTRVGPLPLTTVARTLVDLAAELDPAALRRIVDDALVRDLVSLDRLCRTAARLGGRGRSGSRALRSTLGPWMDGAALESVAEAAAARMLDEAGMPAPVRQYRIVLAGVEMRLDFAWPEYRLAFEIDGFRWHAGPRARDRDAHRTAALIAAGWTVVRATPAQIERRDAAVLEALRLHLLP